MYRLGEGFIKSSSAEKDLGVLMNEKLDMSQIVLLQSGRPGLLQKRGGQQGEGSDCLPLLCPHEILPEIFLPGLGPSAQKKMYSS